MPRLTAACFGKSEQKSVHPFVSFGKVGARRGTFMSIAREKKFNFSEFLLAGIVCVSVFGKSSFRLCWKSVFVFSC